MEIVQVVFFGVLIGGMITFLGIFLQQRYSSVRRRLQVNPRLNTDLMRPQMQDKPVFISTSLAEKLEQKLDLRKDGRHESNDSRQSSSAPEFTLNGPSLFFSGSNWGDCWSCRYWSYSSCGATPTSAAC